MRISQLADQVGVPVSTVRYYERIGLLDEPARTGSGYREYDDDSATRLLFIARARKLGLGCDQIVELLPIWGGSNCASAHDEVVRLIDDKQAEIAARIEELTTFAAELDSVRATARGLPASARLPNRPDLLRAVKSRRLRPTRGFDCLKALGPVSVTDRSGESGFGSVLLVARSSLASTDDHRFVAFGVGDPEKGAGGIHPSRIAAATNPARGASCRCQHRGAGRRGLRCRAPRCLRNVGWLVRFGQGMIKSGDDGGQWCIADGSEGKRAQIRTPTDRMANCHVGCQRTTATPAGPHRTDA